MLFGLKCGELVKTFGKTQSYYPTFLNLLPSLFLNFTPFIHLSPGLPRGGSLQAECDPAEVTEQDEHPGGEQLVREHRHQEHRDQHPVRQSPQLKPDPTSHNVIPQPPQ